MEYTYHPYYSFDADASCPTCTLGDRLTVVNRCGGAERRRLEHGGGGCSGAAEQGRRLPGAGLAAALAVNLALARSFAGLHDSAAPSCCHHLPLRRTGAICR